MHTKLQHKISVCAIWSGNRTNTFEGNYASAIPSSLTLYHKKKKVEQTLIDSVNLPMLSCIIDFLRCFQIHSLVLSLCLSYTVCLYYQ